MGVYDKRRGSIEPWGEAPPLGVKGHEEEDLNAVIHRRVGAVAVVGTLVLAVVAAVVFSAALASAATFSETQTDSIPPTDTDWLTPPAPPDPLVFDQFDATKGTLTQVTITFDSALTGSMAAENTSTSSTCDVTLDWGADVTLDTTDGVLNSTLGQTENPPTLSIFDGDAGLRGHIGRHHWQPEPDR